MANCQVNLDRLRILLVSGGQDRPSKQPTS
jgi:hypothetical protein